MLGRIRLGAKILLSFALCVAVLVVVGVVGITGINSVRHGVDELGEDALPSVEALNQIDIGMNEVLVGTRGLCIGRIFKDPATRQAQFDYIAGTGQYQGTGFSRIEENMKEYEPLPKTPGEASLWEQFKPQYQAFADETKAFVAAAREYESLLIAGADEDDPRVQELDTRVEDLMLSAREKWKPANATLDQLVEENMAAANASDDEAHSAGSRASLVSVVILVVGALAALLIGLYFWKNVKGILSGLMGETERLTKAAVEGDLDARADLEKVNFEFRPILEGFNAVMDRMVGYLENLPAPFIIIDREFNIKYTNNTASQAIGLPKEQLKGDKCYRHVNGSDCQTQNCAVQKAMQEGIMTRSEMTARPGGRSDMEVAYVGLPVKDNSGNVVAGAEMVTDLTEIKRAARRAEKLGAFQSQETQKLISVMESLSQGDLDTSLSVDEGDEDTREAREIYLKIKESLDRLLDYLRRMAEVARKIAQRDLDQEVTPLSDRDAFGTAFREMIENLNQALAQVREAATQTAGASEQISDSSQSLAQGASEQASSLEEVTASVEEIAGMSRQNAESAEEARKLAQEAKVQADRAGQAVERMNRAISEIKASSDETAKIIKTIDEIAFQTNLLALNAAVEAARAGEAGRGFAVVAEEVRNLAMRSAEAAKSTAALIEQAVEAAEGGVQVSSEVAGVLSEINSSFQKVFELVGEIAAAAREQMQGIEQVNQAMGEMDKVTQQNAAAAEEAASASEELAAQAAQLSEMVSSFRLKGGYDSTPSERTGRTRRRVPARRKSSPLSGDGGGSSPSPEEVIPLEEEF
ncbi:MAG: methyl-accepting chemotaxis protein [Candidatus Geothermincolales bacterium]